MDGPYSLCVKSPAVFCLFLMHLIYGWFIHIYPIYAICTNMHAMPCAWDFLTAVIRTWSICVSPAKEISIHFTIYKPLFRLEIKKILIPILQALIPILQAFPFLDFLPIVSWHRTPFDIWAYWASEFLRFWDFRDVPGSIMTCDNSA
jgi:hypothetical protein